MIKDTLFELLKFYVTGRSKITIFRIDAKPANVVDSALVVGSAVVVGFLVVVGSTVVVMSEM